MKIGVVKEIKPDEYRVALTPAGARELVLRGHEVVVERGAGDGSRVRGRRLRRRRRLAGALSTTSGATPIWCSRSRSRCRSSTRGSAPGQMLFTYLHLAPAPELTQALIDSGATCIAYETVETDDRRLPLLAPMSEVAGRLAPQMGAQSLEQPQGGRGILLGGVPGVPPAKVVVLGGGIVGYNAALIAVGMQADVWMLERSVDRMRELDPMLDGRITLVDLEPARRSRRRSCDADLVIGAVLVPGAKAPHLVTRDMLGLMKPRRGARRRRDRPGRLLRDVAADDALRPDVRRRRRRPLLRREHARRGADHVHEGAHERDAAVRGADRATTAPSRRCARSRPLARGLNVMAGKVVNEPVAEGVGVPYTPIGEVAEGVSI